MRKAFAHQSILRSAHFEALEPRMMMSSSPPNVQPFDDADYVLDYFTDVRPAWQPIHGLASMAQLPQPQDSLSQFSLAGAHLQTGLTQARAAYGLTGRGQTVAVIDTGIAFNHTALGGVLGRPRRRRLGLCRKRRQPLRRRPHGSHGTHVAGIIGNSDAHTSRRGAGRRPGRVARVRRQRLRLLRLGRKCTAVGVSEPQLRSAIRSPRSISRWARSTTARALRLWGQLEDEFQQLESVGIFVAVAAGNSFSSYGTPGLSYRPPARMLCRLARSTRPATWLRSASGSTA